MKKVIVLAAAMFLAVAANAQWYVGTSNLLGNTLGGTEAGSILGTDKTGFATSNVDGGKTTWGIAPEIGYNLNEKWAVGLGITYQHFGEKMNFWGLNPYARWFGIKEGNFSVYLQGDILYGAFAGDNWGDGIKDQNYMSIGVKPGIMYAFTEKFSMNASFGFLGYSKWESADKGSFGLNLDGGLAFGLAYSF